jgi:hypothetical protein
MHQLIQRLGMFLLAKKKIINLTNIIQEVYYKNISLKTLDFILSSCIIFMLYNLYYIYQIDKLGICVGPIQETIITIQSNQWK